MELQKTATESVDNSLAKGYLLQLFAYLVALIAAVYTGYSFSHLHPIWAIALADVVGTLVIFGFSFYFKNSSFYDPYWSVGPMAIVVAIWMMNGMNLNPIELATMALVIWWGIRLTYNFLRGWNGLAHQDWRYDNLNAQTGKWYWLVSFSGIHLFPTIMVFLGCLSLFPVFAYPSAEGPILWLTLIGMIVGFTAVYIEAKADIQLHAYIKENTDPQAFLKTGLWGICRHPNYLGEVGFWWGLYLIGLSVNPDWWWTIVGPLAITLMFAFISIPMIDKRMIKRRPTYAAHMKELRALWPKLGK